MPDVSVQTDRCKANDRGPGCYELELEIDQSVGFQHRSRASAGGSARTGKRAFRVRLVLCYMPDFTAQLCVYNTVGARACTLRLSNIYIV